MFPNVITFIDKEKQKERMMNEAQTPVMEKQVEHEVKAYNSLLGRLEKALEEHVGRLAPVLFYDHESAKSDEPHLEACQLAQELHSYNHRLMSAIERIEAATQAVQF